MKRASVPKHVFAFAGLAFVLFAIWNSENRWQLLATAAVLLAAWVVWLIVDH